MHARVDFFSLFSFSPFGTLPDGPYIGRKIQIVSYQDPRYWPTSTTTHYAVSSRCLAQRFQCLAMRRGGAGGQRERRELCLIEEASRARDMCPPGAARRGAQAGGTPFREAPHAHARRLSPVDTQSAQQARTPTLTGDKEHMHGVNAERTLTDQRPETPPSCA